MIIRFSTTKAFVGKVYHMPFWPASQWRAIPSYRPFRTILKKTLFSGYRCGFKGKFV